MRWRTANHNRARRERAARRIMERAVDQLVFDLTGVFAELIERQREFAFRMALFGHHLRDLAAVQVEDQS